MDNSVFDGLSLDLYAALADGSALDPVLMNAAAVLGGDTAFYYVAKGPRRKRTDLHVAGAIDTQRLDEFDASWWERNPRHQAWETMRDGEIVDFDAVTSAASFSETPVWRDFMRHHLPMFHALGVALEVIPGEQARFGVGRLPTTGAFPAETAGQLRRLAPHLRRAVMIRRRLAAAGSTGGLMPQAAEALGVGLAWFDSNGRMLGCNRTLEEMAARRDGVGLNRSGLTATDPASAFALPAAIQRGLAAARSGVISVRVADRLTLRRSGAQAPYVAEIIPLRDPMETNGAHLILLLRDPAAPTASNTTLLQSAYQLTAAEAELAIALAQGLTLVEHACVRGVKTETVRTQLKALLAKTGCRRQAELVGAVTRLCSG